MRQPDADLHHYLDQLAQQARPGDKLPPFRDLMKRFGVSQLVVQRAFDGLRARGLIAAQVGRGTFFVAPASGPADASPARRAPGPVAAGPRSVLLLRRSISIARGRVLVESLQARLAAEGHRVLELSYTDPDHARSVLKGLPRFDAGVIQSTFKALPIETLAALRDRCAVLAVDGAALVGTDVEAVGTEWGEPLEQAVALLRAQGHRRIACASTTHPFLAVELGRRRLAGLRQALPDTELVEIALPRLPGEGYEEALVAAWQAAQAEAARTSTAGCTALVAWGVEHGARLRQLLADAGQAVPAQLSVVLLGRTDLANEHADFFDVVGCRVADQVAALYDAIVARWADPGRPYGIRFVPVALRAGASVAAPASGGPALSRPAVRASVSRVSATDSPT